jgi:hypothetical protein
MGLQNPPKNKELALSIQFAALFLLWSVWMVAIVFVVWRERKLADEMRYYDLPFIIYQLLFDAFPVVLVIAGYVFLWRVRPVDGLSSFHQMLYYVIGVLTFATLIVLLSYGIWAISLPWEVIRG